MAFSLPQLPYAYAALEVGGGHTRRSRARTGPSSSLGQVAWQARVVARTRSDAAACAGSCGLACAFGGQQIATCARP